MNTDELTQTDEMIKAKLGWFQARFEKVILAIDDLEYCVDSNSKTIVPSLDINKAKAHLRSYLENSSARLLFE